MLINQLVTKFKADFESASLTCAAGGLNAKAKRLFQVLNEEFDDFSNKDKFSKIQEILHDATEKMRGNVGSMISNMEVTRGIEQTSEHMVNTARE